MIRRLISRWFTGWRGLTLALIAVMCTVIGIIESTTTAAGFICVMVACNFLSTLDWVYLIFRGMSDGATVTITADEAYSLADEDLPVYTVLLPVFNRPDILAHLPDVAAGIDYPANKLDIYLIVEADDSPTISAVKHGLPQEIRLVIAPSGGPRTKARLCAYALSLPDERGDYVVTFGADEVPDPLQLRKAAYAFANASENVAVFQGKLGYSNESHNLLTKWGALERDRWFSYVLPALSRLHSVVPLGGSSSHIRKSSLAEVGGWNSANATESAEMAIRFYRNGYRTLILDSDTKTKAAAGLRNWSRRRSRWFLGYLQTLGGQDSNPFRFFRDFGSVPALRLLHLTAGWQIWCFVNVALWTVFATTYFSAQSSRPEPFYPLCLVLTASTVLALLAGTLIATASNKSKLLWPALIVPVYWVMQAVEGVGNVTHFIGTWLASHKTRR